MIYYYGGFGHVQPKQVSKSETVFLNHFKAIHCIVGIRGGGERGESWHNAGRRENRTNGFKDVIAFAELIQKRNLTTPDKTII